MSEDPQQLLQDYFDGTLDAERVAELEAYLREDPARAREYVRSVMLDCHLGELLREETLEQASFDREHDADELPSIHLDATRVTKRQYAAALSYVLRHTFTPKRVASLAAAAILLGVVLSVALLGGDETEAPTIADTGDSSDATDSSDDLALAPAVATLTAEHDAVWAEGASAPGSQLRAGQTLTLTQGFAEITTAHGAVAILEAPATIELLDNDNALHLHTGKLVGLCHTDSSKGFVVHTKHADITDLGTEFAVEVMPTGVDTTVFVGSVTLNTPDGATQPITTNQTARLTFQDGKRIIAFEDKPAGGFARRMPRPALITDATINLDGFRVEVVPNGVYEDAKLFTDREHELNGVDAAGLPSFLLGGDLVKMPADARSDRELNEESNILRLEIETSQPCDIYILVRSHVVDGDWLTQHYQPTDLHVGQDYVGRSGVVVKGDNPSYPSGIGPGNSIESELEVWKLKRPVEGRQFVGGPMKTGMYAVLAVPAEADRP
jgi:anti-sigma factor RsiW